MLAHSSLPSHTPSCAPPCPCSPARARAHPLTPRAHTLLRAPMPLLTGTRARAHALAHGRTPRAHAHAHAHTAERRGAGRGGSGSQCPAGRGQERARRGAGVRGRRPGSETLRGSPASSGGAGLGGAALREHAPGHASARELSAAGSAPWTPKRAVARRMTAWTRAQRPEGEPRRAGPWAGGALGVALRLLPGRDLPGPRGGAGAAVAGWGRGGSPSCRVPGGGRGAVADRLPPGPAPRAEQRGP